MSVTPVKTDATLLGGIGVEVALSLCIQSVSILVLVLNAFPFSSSLSCVGGVEGYVPRRRQSWGLGQTCL